jgi:hypothetical protein
LNHCRSESINQRDGTLQGIGGQVTQNNKIPSVAVSKISKLCNTSMRPDSFVKSGVYDAPS